MIAKQECGRARKTAMGMPEIPGEALTFHLANGAIQVARLKGVIQDL